MKAGPVARPLLLRSVSAHEHVRFSNRQAVLIVVWRLVGFRRGLTVTPGVMVFGLVVGAAIARYGTAYRASKTSR